MFDNIGAKIKTLATVSCWIGIAASLIVGIVLLIYEEMLVAILIAVLGSFASWIGSFALYGFGDLIETNRMILAKLSGNNSVQPATAVPSTPESTPAVIPHNESLSAVHQWRCESCGKMISEDICPFCGKAYGQAAKKI